ncbi:uncharacterized protein SOCE26_009960 [Sorangium cellulosum]|uniref:Uncharacterized protein n=1 Tax=Sorangium cellulosum TaxID=56 RepID=A0A2L0EJW6_SORCE|nr:hypothetical protein [Sorangium cellulosum]AUX39602.1 uncharacterized protein SOCE26_009960 [Sorangium cellulosum]
MLLKTIVGMSVFLLAIGSVGGCGGLEDPGEVDAEETEALASPSETGFHAFECIPVAMSMFEKEVYGVGSSCALIGRKKNAESRAIDALEAHAENECEAIRDDNPEVWDILCQEICEFNGYDETTGTGVCSYVVTDTDTWEEDGCVTGDRQYNQQEADVQCGCDCLSDL